MYAFGTAAKAPSRQLTLRRPPVEAESIPEIFNENQIRKRSYSPRRPKLHKNVSIGSRLGLEYGRSKDILKSVVGAGVVGVRCLLNSIFNVVIRQGIEGGFCMDQAALQASPFIRGENRPMIVLPLRPCSVEERYSEKRPGKK